MRRNCNLIKEKLTHPHRFSCWCGEGCWLPPSIIRFSHSLLELVINPHHKVLTYVEYRAESGVFRTILTPHPPLPLASVSSPRTEGGGYTLAGRWGDGGVNISEDARHWIGLLQYNPSTILTTPARQLLLFYDHFLSSNFWSCHPFEFLYTPVIFHWSVFYYIFFDFGVQYNASFSCKFFCNSAMIRKVFDFFFCTRFYSINVQYLSYIVQRPSLAMGVFDSVLWLMKRGNVEELCS